MVSAYEGDESDTVGLVTLWLESHVAQEEVKCCLLSKSINFFFREHHILVLWKKLVSKNLHRNKKSTDQKQEPLPPTGVHCLAPADVQQVVLLHWGKMQLPVQSSSGMRALWEGSLLRQGIQHP